MYYLVLACRVAIAATFLLALAGKVTGPQAWQAVRTWVASVPFVPRATAPMVAGGSLAAEAAVVVLLTARGTVSVGFGLAAVLLTTFSLGLIALRRRDPAANCRCFGAPEPITGRLYARNGLLIAMSLVGAAAARAGAAAHPQIVVVSVALTLGLLAAAAARFGDEVIALYASIQIGEASW